MLEIISKVYHLGISTMLITIMAVGLGTSSQEPEQRPSVIEWHRVHISETVLPHAQAKKPMVVDWSSVEYE